MNAHQRDLLAKLKDDPTWESLRADVQDKKQRIFVNLAQRLMAQGRNVDASTIEREILLATGFFQGMAYLLNKPGATVKEIERELAKEEAPSVEE